MTASTKRPSICIGVPCYREVGPEVLEDWMRFMYHCGRRMPQYDFFLGIRTKSEQFRARNAVVDAAVQVGAEWTLMLDDDMIINPAVSGGPTEDYGFIERLIAHDKDICGVLYYQRGGGGEPVLLTKVGERGYRFLRDEEITGGLQRVDVAGGGCLLIKTKIFDRFAFPYFAPEFEFGTDVQLCRQAVEKGFEVWADTSIEFGHLKSERVIVTSRNRHQEKTEETVTGPRHPFRMDDVYTRLAYDVCTYTGIGSLDEMAHHVNVSTFLQNRPESGLSDADWYRRYPTERILRQVWFNTDHHDKKMMTQFILASIDNHKRLDVLDFGCGIGIPAFTLAEKGHRVTACDIRGTGTLEFLKWRAEKSNVAITFIESEGGPPVPFVDGRGKKKLFDIIVAMDTLEHIEDWPSAVAVLADHLKPHGVLFSNNAILEDTQHPEHYSIDHRAFVNACMVNDLFPFNQITYIKRLTVAVVASSSDKEFAHA